MAIRKKVPSYRFHKARNCAVVRIDGHDHYLGGHGSADSYAEYAKLIANWERVGKPNHSDEPRPAVPSTYTCGRLALDYLRYAEKYYVKNGYPTSQVFQVRRALRTLVDLYETTPAVEFGPLKLKTVRQVLIQQDLSRNTVNKIVGCIKLAFRWGASEELVSSAVFHSLQTVSGLKKGRCDARETLPVLPVDPGLMAETIKFLHPILVAMVQLQLRSGMRPGEVVQLRPCDITMSTDGVWIYRPESHKTEHLDVERRIFLGPEAQEVLRPYLDRDADQFCFSPNEVVENQRAARKQKRRSPMTPSQRARRRKPQARRAASERYTNVSYRRAICRACEIAFNMPKDLRIIPKKLEPTERKQRKQQATAWRAKFCWSPNQLRHSAATNIREKFGIEAAQLVLGHSDANVTQIYAERNFAKAAGIMREIG